MPPVAHASTRPSDVFLVVAFVLLAGSVAAVASDDLRQSIHPPSPSSTPASASPRKSEIEARSAAILASSGLCPSPDFARVIRTFSISADPHALVPDLVDVHYACASDGKERAVLWSPR